MSCIKLSNRLQDPKVSVMNFLNEITQRHPRAISFAPGRPMEKNFEVQRSLSDIQVFLEHANLQGAAVNNIDMLGQYGNTKGVIGEIVAGLIKNDQGIDAQPDDIVVTVGCQEAMCLCLLALVSNPNDVLLVEDPAYVGIVGAAKIFGIEVVGVPTGDNGLIIAELENVIAMLKTKGKVPKALYVSPDFSNPTGGTMPAESRAALLDLTKQQGVVVLEDHAYSYFNYQDHRIDCLKSYPNSEHVIYLGSFSKSVYPGVRMGFVVAGQMVEVEPGVNVRLSDELSKIKSFISVNSSALLQAVVGGIVLKNHNSLFEYTAASRNELRKKRDVMLDALAMFFPSNRSWCQTVQWNRPAGGFFITLSLPFEVDTKALNDCAERFSVIWTPMEYFYINQSKSRSIRLSFSYVEESEIIKGISALADYVYECVSQNCNTVPERKCEQAVEL